MIILLRSIDSDCDSRVGKYIEFYKKSMISYKIINWDRQGLKNDTENIIYFRLKTENNLKERALKNRLKWILYSFFKLFKERVSYKVIHCCDLDSVIPAIPMKLFGKKIIFDVFDWFSDSLEIKNRVLKGSINYLEKISLKIADYVIICEEERKKQMNYENSKVLVLPNIPNLRVEPTKKNNLLEEKLTICYIGTFYNGRNLEILLKACSELKESVKLIIGGYGDEKLVELAKDYSEKFENITFVGKINYSEALKIMNQSDILYAMYCKINKNHIFAAPNKFYESLMLNKTIITTEGTLIGEKVQKYGTGFVIEEDYNSTKKLLNYLSQNKKILLEKEKNCEKVWKEKYKNYIDNFFEKKYLNQILKKVKND